MPMTVASAALSNVISQYHLPLVTPTVLRTIRQSDELAVTIVRLPLERVRFVLLSDGFQVAYVAILDFDVRQRASDGDCAREVEVEQCVRRGFEPADRVEGQDVAAVGCEIGQTRKVRAACTGLPLGV